MTGRDEALYARLRDVEPPARLIRNLHRAPLVDESLLPAAATHTPEGSPLTFRELDSLRYASHGLTSEMTADALQIATDTVRQHREAARRKLLAKTTTHAVALAIRQGLIA